MSQGSSDWVVQVAPAVFGLVGTLVGAGIGYGATRASRLAAADDEARKCLLGVGNAIRSLWWFTKVGLSSFTPSGPYPGSGIAGDLIAAVKDARAAVLNAGVPYRIASAGLEPGERLAYRFDQKKVLTGDPEDAQACVNFLLALLDRRRGQRRLEQAWTDLNAMTQLERGKRALEGVDEKDNTFGH